jgi:hypothetical protein
MEDGLLALDAQFPTLEEAGPAQPDLDDVVYEMTTSEPLVSYVAGLDPEPPRKRPLDPESLDPAIFVGLITP